MVGAAPTGNSGTFLVDTFGFTEAPRQGPVLKCRAGVVAGAIRATRRCHGRGIGKGNRGMSDNEARAVPATNATASSGPAAGPLVVSETNPRYFTVAASDVAHRRAVYLTGSHVNNNFHDGSGPGADCGEVPEPNDFRGYLGFLKERGHNFIRLWRWEQFKSQVAGGAFHFCMTPQPWPRTGPGTAKDGKPSSTS